MSDAYRDTGHSADSRDADPCAQEVSRGVQGSDICDTGSHVCRGGEEQGCLLRVWWCAITLPGPQ